MVWEVANVSTKAVYYFATPGTYSIGRKDCAISISSDKTISRLHAEIVLHPLPVAAGPAARCEFILRDLSKFGTFVNKAVGSKSVLSLPNKEARINDGDFVTFGTGNITFSFKYVHLFFCIPSLTDSLAARARSALGAYCGKDWNSECTHLLVENDSLATSDLLKAISDRKPVISMEWFQSFAAATSPIREIPSTVSYTPTIRLQGKDSAASVRVAHPHTRATLFSDYIFLVAQQNLYLFGEHLSGVVNSVGATVSSLTKIQDVKKIPVAIVPDADYKIDIDKSFQRIKEESFLVAVISASKDSTAFFLPTTDASATSDATVDAEEDRDGDVVESAPCQDVPSTSDAAAAPRGRSDVYCKAEEGSVGEVKYVAGLMITRQQQLAVLDLVPNFKCFRKTGIVAGNSFHCLVPFSGVAYSTEECGDQVEEERKRVKGEEIADDLFNAQIVTGVKAKGKRKR